MNVFAFVGEATHPSSPVAVDFGLVSHRCVSHRDYVDRFVANAADGDVVGPWIMELGYYLLLTTTLSVFRLLVSCIALYCVLGQEFCICRIPSVSECIHQDHAAADKFHTVHFSSQNPHVQRMPNVRNMGTGIMHGFLDILVRGREGR